METGAVYSHRSSLAPSHLVGVLSKFWWCLKFLTQGFNAFVSGQALAEFTPAISRRLSEKHVCALRDAKGCWQEKSSNTWSQRWTTTAAPEQAQHCLGSRPPPVPPAPALGTSVISRLPCLGLPEQPDPANLTWTAEQQICWPWRQRCCGCPGTVGLLRGHSSPCSRTGLGLAYIPPSSSGAQQKGRAKLKPPGAAELLCPVCFGTNTGSQPPWEHEDGACCEHHPAKSSYFQLLRATATSSTCTV